MEPFILTEPARKQISRLLAKQPDRYAVRLSVLGGGCAGFKYDWGFYDKQEDVESGDHVIEWPGGRFVVDAVSIMYVMGTVIDWREAVFGSQFEISNPTAKSGCGCGESFGV
jgi:iron-sulfur cluster assembly accessory protein